MTVVTGEQVLTDRKSRKLSRRAYAELLGPPFTPTKVANVERGRTIRSEELEVLLRVVSAANGANDAPPAPAPLAGDSTSSTDGDAPPVYATNALGEEQDVARGVEVLPPLARGDDDEVGAYVDDHGPGHVVECHACVGVGRVKIGADHSHVCTVCDGTGRLHKPDEQPPIARPQPAVEEGDYATEVLGDVPHSVPTRYDFDLPGYHVTNSELRTFKRCRRKWYLGFYRGLKLRDESVIGPRAIGTRVHLALAAYYGMREDPVEVLRATIADDERRLDPNDVEVAARFQSEAELARIMVEGYVEWLRETGRDQGLRVVAPEQIVEVPFPALEDVVLIGKLDLRVEREVDNAVLFLDHKTVGDFTRPTRTLPMDEQMLHYHLLEFLTLLQQGETEQHTAGGLYNMLRRVKRTDRAKPPFYERLEIQHNVHEIRSYYQRVVGEVEDVLRLRAKLDEGHDHRYAAYPNPTGDCSWDCDFVAVCPLFDDGSAAEEMLAEYYKQSHPQSHYFPYGEAEHERAALVQSAPDANDGDETEDV